MEEKMLNAILLEFQKLNGRLDHMEEEMQNKFALIDARFNTLEEMVLTMQNDIVLLQDRMTTLENRMSNLESILKDLDNRISNLESIVEDLQNKMLQFEDKIQKFGDKMQEFENKMQMFEDRLNTLEKITLRMEYNFNDKISALFDAHSYHNDRYQELDKRIRQNEIKIGNLSLSNC